MHGTHLVNHIHHPKLRSDSTLHVVGVVSNPVRYHSRYRIARDWIAHLRETKNVTLHLVETAFGERLHEVTIGSDLQLRTRSEAWIKEGMINLGMRDVLSKHPEARYLAWVDADVFFRDPYWALETVQELQHFDVVQPWSDCADLGPFGGISKHFRSFGYQHQRRVPKQMHPGQKNYEYAHTGFAWACTRRFWENVRGLMDFAPLGSADHHMGFAMIGEVRNTIHGGMHSRFKEKCAEWEQRALRITKKEVGFVAGRIEHEFHGPKARRYYRERWQILVDHGFHPDEDMMYDSQGLPLLVGKPGLERAIARYNRSRMEDSIEEY